MRLRPRGEGLQAWPGGGELSLDLVRGGASEDIAGSHHGGSRKADDLVGEKRRELAQLVETEVGQSTSTRLRSLDEVAHHVVGLTKRQPLAREVIRQIRRRDQRV